MNTQVANLLIIIVIVAAMMVCVLSAYFLLLAAGRKLRRLGYRPPAVALVVAVSVAVAVILDLWLFEKLGRQGTGLVVGWIGFILGTPLIMMAIAAVLPWRKRRVAGKRVVGFPVHLAFYAGAGTCTVALLLLVSIGFIYRELDLIANLSKIGLTLLSLIFALAVKGRLAYKQVRFPRQANAAMECDTRPPVLFLREFAQERQPFIRGQREELKPYLQSAGTWVPEWAVPVGAEMVAVSLEEYLTDMIDQSLGPLVALGNPEDYLQPIGAAREYAADETWQRRFEQIAAKAQAVLLQPGATNQLSWELGCLLRTGLATRLFVVVGPLTFSSAPVWKLWRLMGWKQPKWTEFRALLEAAGYKVPSECPRPSSVMGFHNDGSAVVITNGGARSPDDYVHAIQLHLANHYHLGGARLVQRSPSV